MFAKKGKGKSSVEAPLSEKVKIVGDG